MRPFWALNAENRWILSYNCWKPANLEFSNKCPKTLDFNTNQLFFKQILTKTSFFGTKTIDFHWKMTKTMNLFLKFGILDFLSATKGLEFFWFLFFNFLYFALILTFYVHWTVALWAPSSCDRLRAALGALAGTCLPSAHRGGGSGRFRRMDLRSDGPGNAREPFGAVRWATHHKPSLSSKKCPVL